MEPASLGRRLGALVIDWVLAALTAMLLFGVSYPPANLKENGVITAVFVVEVALLVGVLGVSIGKRVFRLAVVDINGGPIGVPRALLRSVLLCLVLPAIVMTEQKRGLHDLAAGSMVVRVDEPA